MFLIKNDPDRRLTQHFYIHLFLFHARQTYVRVDHAMMDSPLFHCSVLQLAAGDAQRSQGDSWEGAWRSWHIFTSNR